MSFNIKQMIPYIPVMIVFMLVYMVIYNQKGVKKDFIGYKNAFGHCVVYAFLGIFIVVGYEMMKLCIGQSQYIGLIIPIIWLIIMYKIIKSFLKEDYGVDISLRKTDSQLGNKSYILLILAIAFGIGTLCLLRVIFVEGNKLTDIIPLILATIIFAIVTFVLGKAWKMQHVETIGFKLNLKSILNIFNLLFVLFGILFVSTPVCEYIEYKELEKTTLSTQGKYIGYQYDEIRRSDRKRYHCYYEYEVDGKKYIVSARQTVPPNIGEEKRILYNSNEPDKATVFQELNIAILIIGALFIIIPTYFIQGIVKDIKE